MSTTRPGLLGTHGMVATHWLASGAGTSVLERGGTAGDAATLLLDREGTWRLRAVGR